MVGYAFHRRAARASLAAVLIATALVPATSAATHARKLLSTPVTGLYMDGPGWPTDSVPRNDGPSVAWLAYINPIDPSTLQIHVDNAVFFFASPPGTTLTTGSYPNAVRAAGRGAGQNGIDLTVGSTGCGSFSGSFTVLDLQQDGTGAVVAAAINFEIHCEAQAPGTFGSIRYQSLVGYRGVSIDPYTPLDLSLGSSVVGYRAPDTVVTVTATGTDALNISSVTVSGDADISLASQDCTGGPLAGGTACTIHIAFRPSVVGVRSGSLTIVDDALAGGHALGLAGSGSIADVTPGAVDFGTHELYTLSIPRTLSLRNGPNALTITGVGVYGSRSDFQLSSSTCGWTVAPGATCTFNIRFRPTITAAQFASLIVNTTEVGTLGASLTGSGALGTAISWGPTRAIGFGRWSPGSSLTLTTSSSATYLHSIGASYLVGSHVVTDRGPYQPVLYSRSSNGGANWSTPVRLNPTTQHGDRVAIASSGSDVYAAWVSLTHVVHYSGTAPRVLYVRVNHGYGSGSWSAIHRITSPSGRVDFPVIAASGSSVYLVWTDGKTGAIMIAISRDRGTTWHASALGSTAMSSRDGKSGWPAVAVSDSRVVVAWTADSTGAVVARLSSSSGGSWSAPTLLASSSNSYVAVSASGDRSAVAWTAVGGGHVRGAHVRVATGDVWGADTAVAPPGGMNSYLSNSGPAVALQGSAGIALAWSACVMNCSTPPTSRVDLIWAESTTNGATWARQVVGWSETTGGFLKVSPSIVWASPTLRYVEWTGLSYEAGSIGLYLRAGSGVP